MWSTCHNAGENSHKTTATPNKLINKKAIGRHRRFRNPPSPQKPPSAEKENRKMGLTLRFARQGQGGRVPGQTFFII